MSDDRPPRYDGSDEPGEPRGGWYGSGGAADGAGHFGPTGQSHRQDPYGGPSWGTDSRHAAPYDSAPQQSTGQFGAVPQDRNGDKGGGSKPLIFGGVGLVAGLLLGGAIGLPGGSGMSNGAEPTTVTETTTVETTIEAEAPPAPPPAEPAEPEEPGEPGGAEGAATIDGDGTFLVGADIEPGTYRSAGTDTCYWARLSGTSGNFEEIIANNFGAGQQVVTIDPTDAAFETMMCGAWEKIS